MNALLADVILTGLLYFVHEDVHVYSLFNSSLKDSYLGRQVSLIENIWDALFDVWQYAISNMVDEEYGLFWR